jgi:hypothetical protein
MARIVPEKWSARTCDVVAGSGMLRVTIHPRRDWLVGLGALAWDAFFIVILYQLWSRLPFSFRAIWIAILVAALLNEVHEFLAEEVLEFDSQKLTICKGVHGWERRREYPIEQCSDLGWRTGRRGGPYLALSVGRRSVKFGKGLSEDAANEILTALQRVLPDVAQKMCSYPGGREHFVTLGLNKR